MISGPSYGGGVSAAAELEVFRHLNAGTALDRPHHALLKRTFDLSGSAVLLALLSPVLLLVALAVRFSGPGPVFFVQERIGYRCRVFRMLKFRTMVNGAHHLEKELEKALGGRVFFKMKNDPRITPLGKFLRKYSLDELPQLFNVLVGDMSLVGPRPILLSDFEKFPVSGQMRRFAVKPGCSGLWQVSGRSGTSDERRMELDLEYVDRWSPLLDAEILLRTVPALVRGEGAE